MNTSLHFVININDFKLVKKLKSNFENQSCVKPENLKLKY